MIRDKYAEAASHPEVRRRLERRSVLRDNGCVEWVGALSSNGYGSMTIDKTSVYVHRLAYWVRVGPIPAEMTVDHLCHNPACLNTEHMTITDMLSNTKRNRKAAAEVCPSGHEYSEGNTRLWADKKGRVHRYCITCTNLRNASRKPATLR